MAETADFSYQGDAVLRIKGDEVPQVVSAAKLSSPPAVVIKKIDHLIPIQITCEVDGAEWVVNGTIDYASNRVEISREHAQSLGNYNVAEEDFVKTVRGFIADSSEQATIDEMERGGLSPEEMAAVLAEIRSSEKGFPMQDIKYGEGHTVSFGEEEDE